MNEKARTGRSIMCSERMWRLVKSWKFADAACDSLVTGSKLGPWAATVSREDDRKPVLAIDVRTYLTVAFPLRDAAGFHGGFAEALRHALEDLNVAPDQIAIEAAAVKSLPVQPLATAELGQALKTVDFMCGIELSYGTDLRTVQQHLNAFPHNLPPHYVA